MSIEAVLVIPVFLLFLALLAGIGRTAMVGQDVHAAVVSATRVAAQYPSARSADIVAHEVIASHLNDNRTPCRSVGVTSNTAALDFGVGRGGTVSVALTCTVSLSDLAIPGLPGEVRITESFSTHIDPYKRR
ncbi:MAG: hypothetical protein LBG99_04700 [Propionibacteriaceae bacterium]|nr:hypothetical protein [Propionibacteriaceae bacterium]